MTPYLEIGGDYRETVPGIYLIELPLPFSLGLINVYLVRLAAGWMLVDCGMDTPECLEALARAVEGVGLRWSDINHVLLTHIHPDHMGLAPRLAEMTGAALYLHRADAEVLEFVSDHEGFVAWQSGVLASAGVPETHAAAIESAMAEVQKSFQRLPSARRLEGAETFAGAHGDFTAVWTPGHSPGHICLHSPSQGVLLSGDHMLEHITPNIGWDPNRDALGEYLTSLDTIAALEIEVVLPSHGGPFGGHREWVRRTRRHHHDRCEEILTALADAQLTAADLVGRLWERRLSPFHYRFAVFEVLAHVEHLHQAGRVTTVDRDAVKYWQRARN